MAYESGLARSDLLVDNYHKLLCKQSVMLAHGKWIHNNYLHIGVVQCLATGLQCFFFSSSWGITFLGSLLAVNWT